MNIEQVIERSKEYHGGLDPKLEARGEYLGEDTGYMCAIGCYLKNPMALEKFAYEADVYAIDEIIEVLQDDSEYANCPEYDYSSEPLIKEAMENIGFLGQLKNLQVLHDASVHLSDYLRELSNFNQIPEVKDV